jgi:hypothetical protein
MRVPPTLTIAPSAPAADRAFIEGWDDLAGDTGGEQPTPRLTPRLFAECILVARNPPRTSRAAGAARSWVMPRYVTMLAR